VDLFQILGKLKTGNLRSPAYDVLVHTVYCTDYGHYVVKYLDLAFSCILKLDIKNSFACYISDRSWYNLYKNLFLLRSAEINFLL
jgi:hypothetical protein